MWYILAIIAALLSSIMVLGIKYATTKGFDPAFILFLSFSTSALMALLHINISKVTLKFDWKVISLILCTGILSYIANLLLTRSIRISPNPGYSQAIMSGNIILISVLSYFIFHSDFSLRKIIGAAVCILGITIISF